MMWKNKYYIILIAFAFNLIFFNSVLGQCRLMGTVSDAVNGQTLPYANLQLFALPDSVLFKGLYSDSEGHFAFESIQPGEYYLKTSYMGFENDFQTLQLKNGSQHLDLSLQPIQYALHEVEINAERNILKNNLEKTTIQVSQNETLSGASAREVMQSLPSVDMDIDGKIHYRGSDKVIILINGMPSELVSSLEQIPAEQIDQVEIINNPSAKYDAEGMSGIINLILKKEIKKQSKTTFMLKGGYPETLGGSIGYSNTIGKLGYLLSGSLNRQSKFQTKDHLRKNYENPYGLDYHQFDRQDENRNNALINTNLNYRFEEKQKLQISILGSSRFNTADRYIEYSSLDKSGATINQSLKNIEIDLDNFILDTRLHYQLDYFRKSKLNLQAKWSLFKQLNEMNNQYFQDLLASNPELQNTYSRQNNRERYITLDNANSLGSKVKLESGLLYSSRQLLNDFSVEDLNRQSQEWVLDPVLSNVFNYALNIEAAYLNLNYHAGKLNAQLGLRSEWTQTRVNDLNEDNYHSFFPSASLLYHVNERVDLYSGYNRRINRPTIKMLNPYTYEYADLLNRHTGNPSLQAEFVHSFEAGVKSISDKWTASASLYFRNINQAISRVKSAANDSALVVTFMNLEGASMLGSELFLGIDPIPAWHINCSVNIFRTQMEGTWENNQIDQQQNAWNLNLSNRFKLPFNSHLQVIAYYRSKLPDVMGTYKERYYMDLSLSRKILKNKGKIVLRISDVFNTYRYGLDLDAIDDNLFHYSQRNRRKNESQYFVLSLSYNISQEKKNEQKHQFFLERFGK
jgi:outer membrane cobalamin receptor